MPKYLIEDYLDKLAHQAATSPYNNLNDPTRRQKESGVYKKGHLRYKGLPIAIENPKDSYRNGVDEQGNAWKTRIKNHYGYIKGTVGKDKDHVDIFIGDDRDSDNVYIVNQINKEGKFDEHKVLLGFNTFEDAVKGYFSNYDKNWDWVNSIYKTDIKSFKQWLKNGNTKVPYREMP